MSETNVDAARKAPDDTVDEPVAPDEDEPDWSGALRGLGHVSRCRATLTALEATLVRTARTEGAVWAEIGEELGVTRQTAMRRHRASDPVTAARERALAADPWLQELKALRALARGRADERPP